VETGKCNPDLGSGPVAFGGVVTDSERRSGFPANSGNHWLIVQVQIEKVRLEGAPVVLTDNYAVGEIVEVNILDWFWPIVAVGDCVAATGSVQRFSCGAACDAAGFVAAEFDVIPVD
jgi:hypothetical protein